MLANTVLSLVNNNNQCQFVWDCNFVKRENCDERSSMISELTCSYHSKVSRPCVPLFSNGSIIYSEQFYTAFIIHTPSLRHVDWNVNGIVAHYVIT